MAKEVPMAKPFDEIILLKVFLELDPAHTGKVEVSDKKLKKLLGWSNKRIAAACKSLKSFGVIEYRVSK